MAPSQPSLLVAQILADLMSLQATDPRAATSLVLANLTPPSQVSSHSTRTSSRTPSVPSLKKTNSNMSAFSTTSLVDEEDEDMRRAKELVKLYAKKDTFKQMGDTGLGRAKERVDDVVARYASRH